jgi:hypothetical protein
MDAAATGSAIKYERNSRVLAGSHYNNNNNNNNNNNHNNNNRDRYINR